ncbi:hypothetical protein MF406_00490 [Georgenia sp. TF02-10]|uniref:hypothetical protein n=1 Tax=Georgenia sp. TF02-10 TaxID=2917725 RepID=UPI001FA754AE|nr:hypothetical protein [Georgenia sp. TF02-10]UNX54820.1 hypothetical protein MF406_00490 [Georgenia sp. TF02-10]
MTATDRTSPRTSRPRLRLRPTVHKLVLLAQIAAAGTWLGADVVMAVLVLTVFTGAGVDSLAALVALGTYAPATLAAAGLLTLATGVVLGLGTKYGLVRYWWVAVKLALNVVLVALVFVLLAPELGALGGAAGDALATGTRPRLELTNLLFPPVVSTTAVLTAMTLAVLKPWGRRGLARRRRSVPAGGAAGG